MTALLAPVLTLRVAPPELDQLERAWHDLAAWEELVMDSLGQGVAGRLLALWALSRAGATAAESLGVMPQLVGEEGWARQGGPLLRDMMLMAFSLGAAWEARRGCSR